MTQFVRTYPVFILLLAVLPQRGAGQDEPAAQIGVPQQLPGRDFVFWPGPAYANYGAQDYTIPEWTQFIRRNYYGPMGNFLIRGYDVYEWRETRTGIHSGVPGSLRLQRGRWGLFDNNLVARDAYKGWTAGLIMGDEIRTLFTPLTLNLVGLDGVRLDVQTSHGSYPHRGFATRFSAIASRWEGPVRNGRFGEGGTKGCCNFTMDDQEAQRDASLLLGGHGEVEFGALKIGATGINFHLFDSSQDEFDLRGGLQSATVLPSFMVVIISDDSPEDGQGGAVVSDLRLRINGQPSGLKPFMVRINAQNPTAVGRVNAVTGQIQRSIYVGNGTRFGDVFYLQKHLQGEDVSRNVLLDELLRWVKPVAAGGTLRADGHEQILAYYDLRQVPYVRQVQIEARLGNDYRVEVVPLFEEQPRSPSEEFRWLAGGQVTVPPGNAKAKRRALGTRAQVRAVDNVQDLSNLEWVRLDVGAWTGRMLWGLNGKWEVGDARLRWEFARSVEYWEYPDGQPAYRNPNTFGALRQWNGAQHETDSGAYYVTGEWRQGRLEGGGEIFSIEEDYHSGFVQDNDDNDRFPEVPNPQFRDIYAIPDVDPDGVFPGKDADNDGIPDTNRNGNDIPDYAEPFLLYEVEPDEYVYGRDWNHNGVADERENDRRPDYPYELDQRGSHFFGRLHLPGGLALTLGRLKAHGIASGGLNESTYGQATYRVQGHLRGYLSLESMLEQVHDDIENPYIVVEETLTLASGATGWVAPGTVTYERTSVKDLLDWRNSRYWQNYLEGEWLPLVGLRLGGNVRYAINEQKSGVLADGSDQGSDTVRLLTLVARVEYAWAPRPQWKVIGQGKALVLRRSRANLPVRLSDQWTLVPIVKVQYNLTPRTQVWLGLQGLPGLPLRVEDRAQGRQSSKEEVRALQLTNRSPYFGYVISTNLGIRMTKRRFDDPLRKIDELDVTTAFFRVFLGWEYE